MYFNIKFETKEFEQIKLKIKLIIIQLKMLKSILN